MTENELHLWSDFRAGDETARKELIMFYLPFVEVLAKRIARSTRANWEDLRQEGIIGLIKAIRAFDPERGVPFIAFAKLYIQGRIFDSLGTNRNMARVQLEHYRKIRQGDDELRETLGRDPSIAEIAEKVGLTVEQIQSAIDAMGIAYAGGFPHIEDLQESALIEPPRVESRIIALDAMDQLGAREREIIRLYYWEGYLHDEIAPRVGLSVSNVIKIRQRAINKLRKLLSESLEKSALL